MMSAHLEQFELDLRPSQTPVATSTRETGPPPGPLTDRADDLSREDAGDTGSAAAQEISHGSVTTLEHPRIALPATPPHVLAPTNDLIDKMWTTSGDVEAIDGWTIGELDTESTVFARRVFLGTIATITLSMLVATAWFAAGRGDASLQSTLSDLDEASVLLANTLEETQPVIVDLADGDLADRDRAATAATAVDAAARALFSEASELPATEDASPIRAETVSLSDRSIATARLLSRTTAYSATIDVMFNRPDYPLEVTDVELGDVAEMTATWVSRFIATSSSLPSVNALEAHRNAIVELAGRMPDWQSRYLDSLRSGDVPTAGEVVGELERAIAGLEKDLATALSAVADELDDQRTALVADLAG